MHDGPMLSPQGWWKPKETKTVMTQQRDIPPTGILQEWVAKLGLRHQGVLIAVIRGCDTVPKEDPSKDLSRALRGDILNTHCADPKQSVSFIEQCELEELARRLEAVRKNHDHLPHHFVMHIVHAIEILAYKHPDWYRANVYAKAYVQFCQHFHMNIETERDGCPSQRRRNDIRTAAGVLTVHLTDKDLATLQDMLNHAKVTLPLYVTLKRVVGILSLLENEHFIERYPRLAQVKAEAEQTLREARRILEED